jgi:hypothetical protein
VIGFSQSGTQNVIAAKHVQRQIAIVVVVSVKKTPFLLAMQRQVCGVHVRNNLAGRAFVSLDR